MTLRFKKRGEKALEHALRTDAAQGSSVAKQHKEGSNPMTIPESEEPPLAPSVRHRRELAQVDVDGESDT